MRINFSWIIGTMDKYKSMYYIMSSYHSQSMETNEDVVIKHKTIKMDLFQKDL